MRSVALNFKPHCVPFGRAREITLFIHSGFLTLGASRFDA